MIFSEIEYNNSAKISQFVNSVIDLVSLGTVADIMPISGENRTIIHYGLRSLSQTSHPGLSLLTKSFILRYTSSSIVIIIILYVIAYLGLYLVNLLLRGNIGAELCTVWHIIRDRGRYVTS